MTDRTHRQGLPARDVRVRGLGGPVDLVLLIGVQFGGSFSPNLAVHVPADGGPLAEGLVARIEATDVFEIRRVESADEVADRVARGSSVVGLAVPPGYDAALLESNEVKATRWHKRSDII